MTTKILSNSSCLKGAMQPPGDKSISHRAVMLGSLAQGKSHFTNFLEGEDCLATANAFSEMGASVQVQNQTSELIVEGVGMKGLLQPSKELYLGNSGTTMRLLMGILAGQKMEVTLNGDPSLSSRPMKRVTKPLKQMGAQIKGRDQGNFAPITIRGGKLKGIDYVNKIGSAQVKSAILLAGLYAEGETRVMETLPSRDHTERFLKSAGARFKYDEDWIVVEKTEKLNPLEAQIPGDISSAAFFIVGAAMTPGSDVTIQNVSLNPTRIGLLKVLKRMGAKFETEVVAKTPEPVGHLHVTGGRLKGTGIKPEEIPSLIDELPVLMVAMALAEGESLISGAEELRVKETDRIRSMAHNLNNLGANVEELADGCVIIGVERLKGGKVESFSDHRTVMSLVIATLVMDGDIEIDDIGSVATSFPTFFQEFDRLRQQ